MFCIIYEFDVIPGREDEFKLLWHKITLEVKKHDAGLGSRLHKVINANTKWIAYAQWSTREAWLDKGPLTLNTNRTELTTRMKSLCHAITTVFELEMVDDLLVPNHTKL